MILNRIKLYVRNAFIILIVMIVTVKILDIMVGGFSVDVNMMRSSTRAISLRELSAPGYYLTMPTDSYIAGTDSLEQKHYEVSVNHDGFIVGPGEGLEDDGGPIDIIFLGGSTTETRYVDPADRFPHAVGARLSSLLGRDFRTLNAGVSGNNSLHSTLALLGKVVKYRPRAAVLMHSVNDWSLLSKTGSYFEAPESRKIVKDGGIYETVYAAAEFTKNTLMPNIYYQYLTPLRSRVGALDEFAGYRGEEPHPPEAILPMYRSSVETFIHICRAWGIEPVLMTQMSRMTRASAPQAYLDEDAGVGSDSVIARRLAYQTLFNDEVRRLAREHSVVLVDLDAALSNRREYIYDVVHLNGQGSLAAADLIVEAVRPLFEGTAPVEGAAPQ